MRQESPLKVVVRLLPPGIPEEVVWASMEPHLDSEALVWRTFVQGKPGSNLHKQTLHSRAYIRFASLEALVKFHAAYQGHTFKDSKGQVNHAVVEFAPQQRTPLSRKPDPRQNTISEDPDYLAFLQGKPIVSEPQPEVGARPVKPSEATTTPLVQHLRSKHKSRPKAPPADASPKEGKEAAESKSAGKRQGKQPSTKSKTNKSDSSNVPQRSKGKEAASAEEPNKTTAKRKPPPKPKAAAPTSQAKESRSTTPARPSAPIGKANQTLAATEASSSAGGPSSDPAQRKRIGSNNRLLNAALSGTAPAKKKTPAQPKA